MTIHLVPTLLGGGVRLFDHLEKQVKMEQKKIVEAPGITHLQFLLKRTSAYGRNRKINFIFNFIHLPVNNQSHSVFMGNLSKIGCIFYGISIAVMGFLTIYYHDFPYMFLPPQNSPIPGLVMLTYISGTLLILAGACIVLEKQTRLVSFLLGCVLLLIFCFLYIPYEFMINVNFKHLVEWDNPEKELALAGGAFIIAGRYSEKSENPLSRFWVSLIPFGVILFSIPIISFGILHFLYANDASTLVPSWIPNPIFWTYLAGVALFSSGVAIILQIKPALAAMLLGTMIFIWFIILHIPRVIASPVADIGSEVTSAFLALAYSGIAFVVAGDVKKKVEHNRS